MITTDPTRAAPAGVVFGSQAYHVCHEHGQWFFQLQGHPEAGWTCAGREMVKSIEEQLDYFTKPETGFPEDGGQGGGPTWLPELPVAGHCGHCYDGPPAAAQPHDEDSKGCDQPKEPRDAPPATQVPSDQTGPGGRADDVRPKDRGPQHLRRRPAKAPRRSRPPIRALGEDHLGM
jgi:hypothetical protein